MLSREGHVGQHVSFAVVHEGGGLGDLRPKLVCNAAPLLASSLGIVLGKGRGDESRDDPAATAAGRPGTRRSR